MTKKDYIIIAGVFRELTYKIQNSFNDDTQRTHYLDCLDWASTKLALAMKDENPRFNRTAFYALIDK